jgi:hypothetical protein
MKASLSTPLIIGGGLALVGTAVLVALAGGGGDAPTNDGGKLDLPDPPPPDDGGNGDQLAKPDPDPQPDPKPDPKPPPPKLDPQPPPNPGLVPELLPGVPILDLRSKAPANYIREDRPMSEVRAIVLHQTGFGGWKPDNPLWPKVRAHFVVRQDGTIQCNFDPLKQLRYGSNHANPFCITIEHEGNYPNSLGKWWEGDKFGKDQLSQSPALVASSRKLIAALKSKYPITHVYAHRQWDKDKQNCPGPDIWLQIGEWGKAELGLKDGGPDWHYDNGLAIPASWKGQYV